jgi:hypothetical protein
MTVADEIVDRFIEMAGELVVKIAIRGARTDERAQASDENTQAGQRRVHELAGYSLGCCLSTAMAALRPSSGGARLRERDDSEGRTVSPPLHQDIKSRNAR